MRGCWLGGVGEGEGVGEGVLERVGFDSAEGCIQSL